MYFIRSKKFMYEEFWCGEATFQCSSKYFYTFRFNQTMKLFRYLRRLHPLLWFWFSNLCFLFSIYVSLHHNPKYTLREVIVYHYRFLSSKECQNRYLGNRSKGPRTYNTSHKFLDQSPSTHYQCCLQLSKTVSWHKLWCCSSSNML